MTTTSFSELLGQAENGVAQASVPKGNYDMVVTGARPLAASSMIFLTLEALNGPAAGQASDVSLYFPKEGSSRGAHVYFVKKVGGFVTYPDVKAAFASADNAPSIEAAFTLIAETLVGKQVNAEIGVVTEGEYAGSNELKSTKPIEGAVTAAPVQAQATQVEAVTTSADTLPNGVKAPF